MVQGTLDPIVQHADEELMVTLPAKSKLMFFQESGHFPMIEENEKFDRLMAAFLSLPSGQSPQHLQLSESWKRRVR